MSLKKQGIISTTQGGECRIVTEMDKWQCLACPYIYEPERGDPTNGVPPGTSFEDIPDYWVCPVCGISKDHFERLM